MTIHSSATAHEVTNRSTGKVTTYKTLAAATRAMDRMDNAYGAYITTRRPIYAKEA